MNNELAALRATNARLNRRCQAAESAMADLLACSEKLASGAAWCGGSLGRAFLAYASGQLREKLAKIIAACEPFVAEAQRRPWIMHLSEASGLNAANIGGSDLTNGNLRALAAAVKAAREA